MSTYIWSLKRKGIDYDIKWSSLCEALPYQGGGGLCNICITEKTFIARSDPNKTLNKRSEVMAKCRHKLPFYLNNFHGMKIPETIEEEEGSEEEEEEPDEEQPTSDLQASPVRPEVSLVLSGQADLVPDPTVQAELVTLRSTRERRKEDDSPTVSSQLDGSSTGEGIITRTKAKNISNLEFFEL